MSQFFGLDRPTALNSDSPFAIADHALHDKSAPQVPKIVTPRPRTPQGKARPQPSQSRPSSQLSQSSYQQASAPSPYGYSAQAGQPSSHTAAYPPNPYSQPPPRQSSAAPSKSISAPANNAQPRYDNAMRPQASNPYMGAGAWNTEQSRYGSNSPAIQPQYPQQSRSPQNPYGSNSSTSAPYPYSQPPPPAPPSNPYEQSRVPPQHAQAAPPPVQRTYALQDRPAYAQQPPPPVHQAVVAPYSQSVSPHAHAPSPPSHGAYASPSPQAMYQQPSPAGSAAMTPASVTSSGGSRTGTIQEDELWQMFSAMDLDRSGTLSAKEVQSLLAKDSRWRIEPREDCVKMLMNIFDTDRSGNINFVEFEGLYRYIKDWHAIFHRFDKDRSGTIDRKELEQALQSFGYPLPPDLVRKLEKRFAPPCADSGSAPKGITFDRFLMACVTVKHFTESFRKWSLF